MLRGVKLAEPASPLDRWALSPDVVHLNHGSFGGCPRAVIDAADRAGAHASRRRRCSSSCSSGRPSSIALAAHSSRVLARASGAARVRPERDDRRRDRARLRTARRRRRDPHHRSRVPRVRRTSSTRLAGARGARAIDIVPIALPFDADAAGRRHRAAITPRTRLALLDHITSPTALRRAARAARPAVRGARHRKSSSTARTRPGRSRSTSARCSSGATWYAGNNHKWMCAPKATGFLAAAADCTSAAPVVTSHGATPRVRPAESIPRRARLDGHARSDAHTWPCRRRSRRSRAWATAGLT